MKLIIGLGNTGDKYRNTRHNAGFMLVDMIAEKLGLKFEVNKGLKAEIAKNEATVVAKPTTMMNSSGEAVLSLVTFFKVDRSDLYIVHDDLDIKLGDYKIQLGVGPKVHNGITSIEEQLGSKDFYRIRIGVDNRDPQNRARGEEYVLQDFSQEELTKLEEVIETITNTI